MSDQTSDGSSLNPAPGSGAPTRDWIGFGQNAEFQPSRVAEWLNLSSADVLQLADIPVGAMSDDIANEAPTRDRLAEIAAACSLVAYIFAGDLEKTQTWFRTSNSMLGDVAPRDMIRLGRFDRLKKFILNSLRG